MRDLPRRARQAWTHAIGRRVAQTGDAIDALAPGVEVDRDGLVYVDRNWSPVGVTSQFTDDAQIYHERNFERIDFIDLLERCLQLAGIDRDRALRVLDIGSGGGSSVFAACRLLPRAEIFASDISPQLLRLLAEFIEKRDELRGRVKVFCFDLHRRMFKPDSFDLAIGAAILHHLLDPKAALVHVAESVRPGGKIILVEPLESGSLCLVALCARVLTVLEGLGLGDGTLARLMRALRLDIQSRLGVPVVKPWTAILDDKWVFDEPYLIGLARELGLSGVEVHPAQPQLANVFEGAFRSFMSETGNPDLAIPPEVIECVREFDRGFAADLKATFAPTGIIEFNK